KTEASHAQADAQARGPIPKPKAAPPAVAAPRGKAAVAANRAPPVAHSPPPAPAKASPLHPLPSLASIEAQPLAKQQRTHPTPPASASTTQRSSARPTPIPQRPEVAPAETQTAKASPAAPAPASSAPSIAAVTETPRVEQKTTTADRA